MGIHIKIVQLYKVCLNCKYMTKIVGIFFYNQILVYFCDNNKKKTANEHRHTQISTVYYKSKIARNKFL